jgi:hypothetical protein
MKILPQLGERTVEIKGGNGKVYEVEKFSIDEYDKLNQIIDEVDSKITALGDSQETIREADAITRDGADKIRELVTTHMPDELKGDMFRLQYLKLFDLAMYLVHGTEQNEDGEPAKKKPTRRKKQ